MLGHDRLGDLARSRGYDVSTTSQGPIGRVLGPRTAAWTALRSGWRAYACEALGLGGFLLVVGVVDAVVWAPQSPVSPLIASDPAKRAVVGVAAGLYLIALIYSPLGHESGAQINPSITLAYLRLKKIRLLDAGFYIGAQFIGAVLGVLVFAAVMPSWAAAPQVNYIVTAPGIWGYVGAFVAELCITFAMMLLVLESSNRPRLKRYTGLFCGSFLAFLILVESPISGTSLNPARSTGSALIAGGWYNLALYFIAPVLGAQIAIVAFRRGNNARPVACAKLHHPPAGHPGADRCIMKDCAYRAGPTGGP
jgi:aquaporin Z